jgi:hypothetical protein
VIHLPVLLVADSKGGEKMKRTTRVSMSLTELQDLISAATLMAQEATRRAGKASSVSYRASQFEQSDRLWTLQHRLLAVHRKVRAA